MHILPYPPHGPVVSITWERLWRVGGSASRRDVQPLRHQEAGMPEPVGQGGPRPDGGARAWAFFRDWGSPRGSSGLQDKPELQRKDSHPSALG